MLQQTLLYSLTLSVQATLGVVNRSQRPNRIIATIPMGPTPRFLAAGEGGVWTLSQGDDTVTRMDIRKAWVLRATASDRP